MRFKSLVLLGLSLGALGCGPHAPATPPQSYDLDGMKVEFSPPDGWAMTREKSKADTLVDFNKKKIEKQVSDPWEAMVFESPTGKSRIAVTALTNVTELDKPQLNSIWEAIERRGGKKKREWYYQNVSGDKENGFTVEYEIKGENVVPEDGKQVHFVKNKHLFSITLDDPSADYSKDVGQFDNVVSSFQVK